MCGLEYVLIIITTTINQTLFVECWDIHIKVQLSNYINFYTIIVDGTGYSSSFLDLPTLPLLPYEFSCSGTEQSLLDCHTYPITCYNFHYRYNYVYGGVTCQSISYFYSCVYLYIL